LIFEATRLAPSPMSVVVSEITRKLPDGTASISSETICSG